MKKLLTLLLLAPLFIGCSSDDEPLGLGMDPVLSENNLTFTSEGGTKEIYTQKEFMALIYHGQGPIISIEKDTPPDDAFRSLSTEWMTVKRTSKKNIEITVSRNETNREKIDLFYVFNGNWMGQVIVKQY